jgi:UDP-2-acetamido-3-amino-2,3-dideoxy-glucuronate N-acetyltransferase
MSQPAHPDARVIDFSRNVDARGALTVGEYPTSLPFEVLRFFLVKDVPTGETRGDHAHRECHQLLICTAGRVDVTVISPVGTRSVISLDAPDRGLHIPPLVWAQQRYVTSDASLLVFASHRYEDNDYLRDFDEYSALLGAPGVTAS